MDTTWKYVKILFTIWLTCIILAFVGSAALSIYTADQKNPGGYCEDNYRYDRWSYPPKLMRNKNGKPIPC